MVSSTSGLLDPGGMLDSVPGTVTGPLGGPLGDGSGGLATADVGAPMHSALGIVNTPPAEVAKNADPWRL